MFIPKESLEQCRAVLVNCELGVNLVPNANMTYTRKQSKVFILGKYSTAHQKKSSAYLSFFYGLGLNENSYHLTHHHLHLYNSSPS